MKESDLVKKIKDWLNDSGALAMKYHGSPYSIKGHCDLYGVLPGGRAFFLEVKLPGRKPEPWQAAFLTMTRAAGAATGWCDSLDGAKRLLSPYLKSAPRT